MPNLTREQIEQQLQERNTPLVLPNHTLQALNLAHLDMRGANLQQCNLRESNLQGATLQHANLEAAQLDGANLSQAHLNQANLRYASLQRTTLREANLSEADLRETNLIHANLIQAVLTEATLHQANLSDADLSDADLSDTDLGVATLMHCNLAGSRLHRTRLPGADLREARLENAELHEANLQHTRLENVEFGAASMEETDLRGADLRGANLHEATLRRVDLRGAIADRYTRWPDEFAPYEQGVIASDSEQPYLEFTTLRPGAPYPLGATWDGQGVNFALYARNARRVELCLFDSADAPHAAARILMPEQTDDIWHVYVPHLTPGQLYAYRVYGPFNPEQGLRFNPNKLLLDPYAKAITGTITWNDAVFGYHVEDPAQDLSFDERDSTPSMPRCVVVDSSFPWDDDCPPRTPLHNTLIYELNVRGFTRLHPGVPESMRGTYAGLAAPEVIDYLQSLGITAVELQPVHHHVDDHFLVQRGLRNYWGYNTIGYFAPDVRYSRPGSVPGTQVQEFKAMVKALHKAGIEVILDVVYNHTAEGNHLGPHLSLRGIDNQAYYRLVPGQPRYYMDYTGTGNSLNMLSPAALNLVTDSLRYWITEMHVDGFRFDLAATLARGLDHDDRLSSFFDVIYQDPVISQVKLIAEPWDIGPGGYQIGNFPVRWSEWNGRYRDTVRRFWKGDEAQVGELAYRLSGSSDLYQHNGRRPYASINFVTAHDGFTLHDLVSYNHKHNEANKEDNRDGDDNNNSWNCGVEGPTNDPHILALRSQQMRNLMATLLLSQGVPMILAGDERARTQHGNNNAYCQDNEISWLNWALDERSRELLEFTRQLVQIRQQHPVLRRRRFFHGRRVHGANIRDIIWLRPDGGEMSHYEWSSGFVRCLGMLLNGQIMSEWGEHGHLIYDDILLLLVNAHHERIPFFLPHIGSSATWHVLVDTISATVNPGREHAGGEHYPLEGRSLALLLQQ